MSEKKDIVTFTVDVSARSADNSKSRLFRRGSQCESHGTVSKWVYCNCGGSGKTLKLFYRVIADGIEYHVDSQFISLNVPIGPTPSLMDRLANMGDGHTVPVQDSYEQAAIDIARNESFKIVF